MCGAEFSVLEVFDPIGRKQWQRKNFKGPTTTSTTRDLVIRNTTDTITGGFLERTAVTGKEEFRLLGYSRDPRVIVSQSFPLDLQINGMIVEVAF